MNKVIDSIVKRKSLRSYSKERISKEHMDILIQSAMRAPTAGNMMLYSIILIEKEETKKTLSKTCDNQPFIAEAPLVMVFTADYQKWYDYYNLCKVDSYCERNGLKFTGPTEANLLLAANDAIIAAQNVVIAAESLGIGSCYIGDIMENYETHKELLDLPDFAFPVAMLCLGYYPENYNIKPRNRFNKEFVVFNEKYNRLDESQIKEMFGELEDNYSSNNKFDAENFGQIHYRIKTGADFSKEMERSVKEALKIWSGKNLS